VAKIILVADRRTARCFRLAGLSEVYPVRSTQEAERLIIEFSERRDVAIILITEPIANAILSTVEKLVELEHPRIIPIPDLKREAVLKADLTRDLIKRKSGIEFKL